MPNLSNNIVINITDGGSTGRGILIGVLSAFGSAGIAVLILAVFFFFRSTNRGRLLLDRIGRPGEFDDEQAFAREEAEALESMDDMQRADYLRAKAFIQGNVSLPEAQATLPVQHYRFTDLFSNSRPRLFRPISPSPSFWLFKRRVFLLGNLSQSWR